MSSMGEFGEAFPLGGDVLELGRDLLLLLLLPPPPPLLFICWPRRLVCCSSREWILLLPSALQTSKRIRNKSMKTEALWDVILSHQRMLFLHHDRVYNSFAPNTIHLNRNKAACHCSFHFTHLVFFTAILLLSFSSLYSPVSWLTIRMHSFM